ncbi:MAG: tetratricopeptide repeat protein, partial [Sandaracinaceae bacterium]
EDGTTEDVATEDGATDHGATGDVATEDGATGDVATGDVATGDVATGDVATEDGATEDGATEDGATEDVATEDVATEDVATEDGAGGVDPSASPEEQSEAFVAQAERAGQSDLAVGLYRRALAIDSRNHHAMIGLGELLLARNQPSAAIELFERAVRRRPRRASYRVLLGDARAAGGDAAGARRDWEEALSIDPEDRRAQQRLGQ